MYGAQAVDKGFSTIQMFENDVEMYGAQAPITVFARSERFENDVEMYGAQAYIFSEELILSLRMM